MADPRTEHAALEVSADTESRPPSSEPPTQQSAHQRRNTRAADDNDHDNPFSLPVPTPRSAVISSRGPHLDPLTVEAGRKPSIRADTTTDLEAAARHERRLARAQQGTCYEWRSFRPV